MLKSQVPGRGTDDVHYVTDPIAEEEDFADPTDADEVDEATQYSNRGHMRDRRLNQRSSMQCAVLKNYSLVEGEKKMLDPNLSITMGAILWVLQTTLYVGTTSIWTASRSDASEAESFKHVYWDALKLSMFHAGSCNIYGCVRMTDIAFKQDAELAPLIEDHSICVFIESYGC
ncbi:hypothetical protein BDV34DRAFT_222780 [Aspergillus parasiticus]|uniref:Uncharacterized protein n=1 Tax=Aspergillus parasiticus TaxID=5067 RepID=A0A5N6DW14_ASPPA|nr:hypothetical protein BDV34DRAFT_222780 [Aspergillus parasiticus]